MDPRPHSNHQHAGAERLSFVLPALNEEENIGDVVAAIRTRYPDAELIVVDDGSTDATAEIARQHGAKVISHPYNTGNGASIKSGVNNATGDLVIMMDADGQHSLDDLPRLLQAMTPSVEMVVGARTLRTHASHRRLLGNVLLNKFAGLMTGKKIPDLTSGFRVVRRDTFKKLLYLLPNGFSYPTTSTMAHLRLGLPIVFVPIEARSRKGKSKINLIRDGVKFLIIIMKITTLFSPMRVFFPTSLAFFTAGIVRYSWFYATTGNFSGMAGVMFITAILIFLIGLVSEQITSVHYSLFRH